MEDRQTVITEFAKWMLEDPSPDNVAWVADMSNLTSGTVASVLNATGFYLDYSADLVALEGGMPLLYVVREDWQAPADERGSRPTRPVRRRPISASTSCSGSAPTSSTKFSTRTSPSSSPHPHLTCP